MRDFWRFSLILLIKLLSFVTNSIANEVLGCGGFIKSHADIDYSKVEIKLLTKQGSLKDKTDCSPSNGYYFLPIYDKGEYLLKISPPPGWSFEPEQVELNFDASTDICSQGKDVNFVFKGFGITGKVALAGTGVSGARGVQVELKSEDGKDTRKTLTDINGIFSFTPIIPGKYIVKASHPKWYFSKNEYKVEVTSGNTELPADSLIVSGFDVVGKFDLNDQLPKGLGVAIFKEKGQTLPLPCHREAPKSLQVNAPSYAESSACHTLIEKNGIYSFKGVPPGKYLLQPYVDSNSKLFFNRLSMEVVVTKDTLEISEMFKITGFSVSGRVLSKAGGRPLSSAVVKLNKKKVAETDAQGLYTLDSIKPGSYLIEVEAPKLQFEERNVRLNYDTSSIEEIYPSAFEVCGKVVSEKSYTVGVTKLHSTFYTKGISEEKTGEWCVYLGAGQYIAEVVTSSTDRATGIQFFPLKNQFEVTSEPLMDLNFSQLRATLKGEVKCLPDAPSSCKNIEVTLISLDVAGRPTKNKETIKAKNGRYVFEDILPGPYAITIPQMNLCFDVTRVLVNVASTSVTANPFIHKGYEISIISSHRTLMKYHFENPELAEGDAPSPMESLKLVTGMNTICVEKYGKYNFHLESCHLFKEDGPTYFETFEKDPVILDAVAHKVGVRVLSTEPTLEDLELLVETVTQGKSLVTPKAESHKVDDKYAFRFDTYLKPDEMLKITPQSNILLFTPQSKDIIGGTDCMDIAFNFHASRGLILRGKVVPAIKDVDITLVFPKHPEIQALHSTTTITGEFKFGPIDPSLDFDLTARKDSYVFSPYNKQTASFSAHKLCEINVKVKDENGEPLSGVLVSLSGAESYRKNLVSGEEGFITFHSLSPAQYFLRPMMKEYKFEPNSKIIDIKDGETLEVDLIGKRHAYSIFGMVKSLNGEPFSNVNVEATADENCLYHQEEATSELTGQYRIRGLQPGCTYSVYLKDIGKANSNIERSLPENHSVQIGNEDVRNINIIAFSPIEFTDIIVRVTAASKDHYKNLRLVMYKKGSMDSPIYSQKVDLPLDMKSSFNPGIIHPMPRVPLDGKTYVIELRSTLSDKTYKYSTPVAYVNANICSIFVELDFSPELRTTETELNQNSIGALILVTLIAIAFFKQDIAMNILDYIWSRASNLIENLMQKHKTSSSSASSSSKREKKIDTMSQKEIDQLAEQINSIKKKKTKKI